ncbi:MAG: hypothetical protein HQL22_07370 [Candidatus Omnitrophica bacterium]|nr:hypothetical protein [Candidatus Omnitrophota bacterium]
MKTLIKNERRMDVIESAAIWAYRFMEGIDGERGVQLVPYVIIQPVKMQVLTLLEEGVRMKIKTLICILGVLLCFSTLAHAKDKSSKTDTSTTTDTTEVTETASTDTGSTDSSSTTTSSSEVTNWKQEKKVFRDKQAAENKTWFTNFEARKNAALEQYKSEGLAPEQIREKMQTFRDEVKTYRETQGTENKEFRDTLKKERQTAMDTNTDGKVSKEERQDYWKSQADTNKDGKISQSERQNFRDERRQQRGQGGENAGDQNQSSDMNQGSQDNQGSNMDQGPQRGRGPENRQGPDMGRGGRGQNMDNPQRPQGAPHVGQNQGNNGVRDHGQGQRRNGRRQGGERRGGPQR